MTSQSDDWQSFRAISAAIALACVLHGATTGNWKTLHTVGLVVGLIGTIGPDLG